MSKFVQTRIGEDLHDDLSEIAAKEFEGNLSMVVRLALREFRDRNADPLLRNITSLAKRDDPPSD